MPTTPDERFYLTQAQLAHAGVPTTLAEFADLLDELVAYGTHVLASALDAKRGAPQSALPAIALLRRGFELGDGVAALIRMGAPSAAPPILRVVLEIYLQYKYLLQDEQDRRGLAFLYFELRRELGLLDRLDRNTPEGRELQGSAAGDEFLGRLNLDTIHVDPNRRLPIEQALESSTYVEVRAEEMRIRRLKPKRLNWYSLFDGPANLEQLAGRVGGKAMYQTFYRLWSESVHGLDAQHASLQTTSAGLVIRHIRNPDEAQRVTVFTAVFLVRLLRQAVISYTPDRKREFVTWYRSSVRGGFRTLALGGAKITVRHEPEAEAT